MLTGEMSSKVPSIKLKIDPRDLQIQTFTVEKLLEPLIIQERQDFAGMEETITHWQEMENVLLNQFSPEALLNCSRFCA
ncbi:catenin alpha-3 [Limosa lapponica baueri]|uniref:Catenin alpha-3 n=1 Tax=Limosa lapponica baueri TaxID=1758121 RepID=A0A2I0TGA7_LIMLA|nr:catenin alpha-3 [Limosa lapponica baueri]